MLKSKKKQFGQGMTEYIIIVALIAVSAITVYNLFGKVVRTQVGGMAAELGGGEASGTAAKAAGDKSLEEALKNTGLKDFKQEEPVGD